MNGDKGTKSKEKCQHWGHMLPPKGAIQLRVKKQKCRKQRYGIRHSPGKYEEKPTFWK